MQGKVFKYGIKVAKRGELKFLSHLDWQNLIIKTLRRCGLDLVLTEGFNKIPKTSFSPALPIFIESECELVYFQTKEPLPSNFGEIFAKSTNKNVVLLECYDFTNLPKQEALDIKIQWASYVAKLICNKNESILNSEKILYNIEKCLSSDELLIEKKTKKGINKVVNYRKSINSIEFVDNELKFVLKAGQDEQIPALRADEFLRVVFGIENLFEIKRLCFFDKEMKVL